MCQEDVHFSVSVMINQMKILLSAKKWETLLCAAVGTASHQRGLDAYVMGF
jgi:hypothetical protein